MFGSVAKILPDQVEQRLQDGSLHALDIRTHGEVKNGKIPGALHIPLQELSNRVNEVNKDKEYVCVCRSGGRSGKAAKYLKNNGYHVLNMDGGMMKWKGKVE